MKTSDGSFHYCYNAQTVVDDAHQVILATRLSNRSADCPEFASTLDEAEANCGTRPRQGLADAGYFSEDNVAAAAERGIDALIATGRLKHGEAAAAAPRGPIPKHGTTKERMARKLRTKPGRAAYKRRKAIIEPVFGQIDTVQGSKKVLLRGEAAANAEWQLLAACTTCSSCSGLRAPPQLAAEQPTAAAHPALRRRPIPLAAAATATTTSTTSSRHNEATFAVTDSRS